MINLVTVVLPIAAAMSTPWRLARYRAIPTFHGADPAVLYTQRRSWPSCDWWARGQNTANKRRSAATLLGLSLGAALVAPSLRADLFIPARRVLVEAKASAAREHLRTAIGQLLDYGRYLSPPATLCVLTPTRPPDDMISLLLRLEIVAVWPEGNAFASEPSSLFSSPLDAAPIPTQPGEPPDLDVRRSSAASDA